MDYSKERFDIIIQAGQSNAEGCGLGDVTEEYVTQEDILYLRPNISVAIVDNKLDIKYLDDKLIIEVADERVIGEQKVGDFSLTFAKDYVKSGLLKDGRKLLIIRAAVGGTGFFGRHWGMEDILYIKMREMIDYALSLNKANRLVAFLWHQGEHDAFEGSDPKVYFDNLSSLIGSVRNAYNVPGLPFIAGDFVNEWKSKNIKACDPIVNEIKEVCKSIGRAAFVETADLPSNNQKIANGDDIHFCRESLHILGHRYFEKYEEIIKGA